jgi:hypothetical protein
VLRQFGLPREALRLACRVQCRRRGRPGLHRPDAASLLAALRRRRRSSMRAVAAGSWGVVIAGGWWFVERVFFNAG